MTEETENKDQAPPEKILQIKHAAIGAATALAFYGAVKALYNDNIFDVNRTIVSAELLAGVAGAGAAVAAALRGKARRFKIWRKKMKAIVGHRKRVSDNLQQLEQR